MYLTSGSDTWTTEFFIFKQCFFCKQSGIIQTCTICKTFTSCISMGDFRGCLPEWYSDGGEFVCPGCYQSKGIMPPVVIFFRGYLRYLAYQHCLVFDTPSIRCIEPCRDEYITFNNIHRVLWRRASLADACCHAGRTGTWLFSWQGISTMTLFMSTFLIMTFVAGEPTSYCFTAIPRYSTIYHSSCQKYAIDLWFFCFLHHKVVLSCYFRHIPIPQMVIFNFLQTNQQTFPRWAFNLC